MALKTQPQISAQKTNGDVNALVIFVDIRGFTAWAEKVDHFSFIDDFGKKWYTILKKTFDTNHHTIKYLGDGAMIIREIEEKITKVFLEKLLVEIIDKINNVDKRFSDLCDELSIEYGSKISLALGWGVTKGIVKRMGSEYIGAEINKSSRYCNIARPFGVVIDAVDFPNIPSNLGLQLFKQERILEGIRDTVEVLVSKEISSQFLTREKIRQSPEVHVAGVCCKKENGVSYILLGKRVSTRRLYPNKYEGCGGQLALNETFVNGVKRHYKLEYGIEVDVIKDAHLLYEIQVPNEPIIPGISFLCKYLNGEPMSNNHETLKWYTEEDFNKIPETDFIPGFKKEAMYFFEKFNCEETNV